MPSDDSSAGRAVMFGGAAARAARPRGLRRAACRWLALPLLLCAPAWGAQGDARAQAQAAAQRAPAVAATPPAFAALLKGAPAIGQGPLYAYRVQDHTLVSIPVALLDRLFFWYVEAARFPQAALSMGGNSVAEAVVTLERQGTRLLVRDRSPSFLKRSASGVPTGKTVSVDPRRADAPIDRAIDAAALGPVIAVLPILADSGDRLLIDITATFSSDIDGLTAVTHIMSAGMLPAPIGLTVDAARSYIADVDVYPDNLHVRSQLTFRAQDPSAPELGFRPVSIELGHSLIMLPERPMAARRFDDRVGFIFTNFTEYETASGVAATNPLQGVIRRFRLEKANPSAAVSDPVKPIVFYIGQGVPDRWRPYIKAAVESWEPVFRAAGFSNAIVARNAPTPAEDPRWSPEDARYNVIRWVPQAFANAQGPSVADPRSGEILFAHILLWPDVLGFFQNYYWLMANGVDPSIKGLPLSEAKQGELLTYIVAHEVGHSIGLRHNHLASTAYSVAELRNPAFANTRGANASIMAYGRMNQVAQPGDGVTRVLGMQGPYDYFAIDWGYGVHAATPADEQAALDRMAAASVRDRLTRWAAGEYPFEDRWSVDPRVLMESVGAERVEATRLGLTKLAASVAELDAAAPDDDVFRSAYGQAMNNFHFMMASVVKLVGGQLVGEGERGRPAIVPAAEQRAAVRFLLDEAPPLVDVFLRPGIALRANSLSGDRRIDAARAGYVRQLLAGPQLAQVQTQHALDPTAYGVRDLADDVTASVWGRLERLPSWRAAQQVAYLDRVEQMLQAKPNPQAPAIAAALAAQMHSQGYIDNQLATGAETVFPAYAREMLPAIKSRLDRAAKSEQDATSRLHLLAMSERIASLLRP